MIDLCYKMLKTVCNVQLFEPKTMYIFLITIKEMHRPHPFHNFEKSFSSMHGVFCILSRIGDKFDDVEVHSMSYIQSCNCLIIFMLGVLSEAVHDDRIVVCWLGSHWFKQCISQSVEKRIVQDLLGIVQSKPYRLDGQVYYSGSSIAR